MENENNKDTTSVPPTPTPAPAPILAQAPTSGNANKMSISLIKYFVIIMSIGIGIAAIISIIAVLTGEWNGTISKLMMTTFYMTVHALAALAIMSTTEKTAQTSSSKILAGITFAVIVASFFTSVAGTWEFIGGQLVWSFYKFYLWLLVTSVVNVKLYEVSKVGGWTKYMSYLSAGITTIAFLYAQPSIFSSTPGTLPDLYFRGQTALIIALFSSLVVTLLLNKVAHSKKV